MKSIRVLVIDDSLLFQELIKKGIQTDEQIIVVETALNPFEARDKILEHHPDVITCDIEMPRMDGIEFIRRLLPQYSVPVIVVSAINNKVFDAMKAGAVDFVTKPDASSPQNVQRFIYDLIEKIKVAQKAQITIENKISKKPNDIKKSAISHHKLIAIGASTGGTEAIFSVLSQLPLNIPGIVIVQHIPPVFSTMFSERLNKQTHFRVKEADHGDIIKDNHVYLAPGNKHMTIKNINGILKLEVFEGDKVNGHCPSVDVLFLSIAKEIGDKALQLFH